MSAIGNIEPAPKVERQLPPVGQMRSGRRLSEEDREVLISMKPGESFVTDEATSQSAYQFARAQGRCVSRMKEGVDRFRVVMREETVASCRADDVKSNGGAA